jgi:predicted secreted protein
MNGDIRDLIPSIARDDKMMKSLIIPVTIFLALLSSQGLRAELEDQGLNSIMEIIDKAIAELTRQPAEDGEEADPAKIENATATVVSLSRTLGTLSYSRLQCGEAGVLAEFTSRVQLMPEESRDPMRDAFQEGFDKSKEETPLLSQDECQRLTASRKRREAEAEANVKADEKTAESETKSQEVAEKAASEDPKLRHLRIAELSGQLAFRRRVCEGEKVFNRDYNEYLESIPEAYREEAKAAYWKGYTHGKRLNENFTREQCPQA